MDNRAIAIGSVHSATLSFDAVIEYADGTEESQVFIVPAQDTFEVELTMDVERQVTRVVMIFHSQPLLFELLRAEVLAIGGKIIRSAEMSSNALTTRGHELCFAAGSSEITFSMFPNSASVLKLRGRVRAQGASAYPAVLSRVVEELHRREEESKKLLDEARLRETQQISTDERWKLLVTERDALHGKVRSLLDGLTSQTEKLSEFEGSEERSEEAQIRAVLLHDFGVSLPKRRLEMLVFLLNEWSSAAEQAARHRQEIELLRDRLAAAESALSEVTRSRSWRLTGTIRAVGKRLRRLRSRTRSRR